MSTHSSASKNALTLRYTDYPSAPGNPVLLFLHGLLGSRRNLRLLAQQLSCQFHVFVPDLRNHGDSPHHDQFNYQCMIQDIAKLIQEKIQQRVILMGHSMGGKVALLAAATYPELISHLCVVDIAPVHYPFNFAKPLQAMMALNETVIKSIHEADQCLKASIPNTGLRKFMLTNLTQQDHYFVWRPNLAVIQHGLKNLGFPTLDLFKELLDSAKRKDGPHLHDRVLFIAGEKSPYLKTSHHTVIYQLFPQAQIVTIPNAGHFVHTEKSGDFMQVVKNWWGSLALR